jgi:hypothetical protein
VKVRDFESKWRLGKTKKREKNEGEEWRVADHRERTPVKRRREGEDRRASGGNGTFVRKLERERENLPEWDAPDDGEGRPPREKPATSLTGEEICTERNFKEREGLGSVGIVRNEI